MRTIDELTGKKLVILGLGRQGIALARFADTVGAEVTISDLRQAADLAQAVEQLSGLPIRFVLGEHPLWLLDEADILAVSGGVPADSTLVRRARQMGITVTNDSREFIRRSVAQVLGITGSAGKTTTSALVAAMGKAAGKNTWLGGNIGNPLITELGQMSAGDLAVQELSSFQLELWRESPPIASVLNLTPNHLDRHQTMQAYADAKGNILRFQAANDVAVLSADDRGAQSLAHLVRGRLRQFSTLRTVADGSYVEHEEIWLASPERPPQSVCTLPDIQLRGAHNIKNVCAAVTLADSAGIPAAAMRDAVRHFAGVEHRLELVATINGVKYVNDSIATAPERALAAVVSFEEPIILLAGGKDKNMSWAPWAQQIQREVKAIVLFGELAPLLQEQLALASSNGSSPTISRTGTMEQALHVATERAQPGDVVLLAPGGTSFDAFADFAERGRVFRQLVREMAAT